MNNYMQGVAALSLYFISSVVAILMNKIIVSRYMFSMHYFLILIQSASIVLVIMLYFVAARKRPNAADIGRWWIASLLLTTMIFTNVKAVYYFPVTLFTLLQNLSIILTALLEFRFFGKKITTHGFVSLALIALSSYSGNIIDPGVFLGYLWMAANILSTVGYMLYLRKLMVFDRASKLESVLYTNLLSIPILGALSWAFDPPGFMVGNATLWRLILASAMCAFLTAISTVCTLKALCSTTLCMAGALNKLLLALGGLILFQENASLLRLFSIFVGLFASVLYTLDSLKAIANAGEPLDTQAQTSVVQVLPNPVRLPPVCSA